MKLKTRTRKNKREDIQTIIQNKKGNPKIVVYLKKTIIFVKNLKNMKTKVIALLVLFTTLLVGCKKEKAVDDLDVVKSEVVDNDFKVVLEVVAKKKDDFALLYTVDGSINFYTIPVVWQGVPASDAPQEIAFVVPGQVVPTQLRFDLGMKQDQPDIVIKSVKLLYKGKTFKAEGIDVFKYFRADENQCKVDIPTGTVVANMEDGKRKTPSLYPIEAELGKQIANLAK